MTINIFLLKTFSKCSWDVHGTQILLFNHWGTFYSSQNVSLILMFFTFTTVNKISKFSPKTYRIVSNRMRYQKIPYENFFFSELGSIEPNL